MLQLGSVGRGKRRGASTPMAEINIIPLVDVTLVLLIIFMATTAFVKEAGLNMNLPAARTQETTPDQNGDLNIALTRAGGIYLDGRASSEEQVQSAMQVRARHNAATRVVIKGDEKIEYARVVRVMDMARQAGLPRVALGTRLPEGS
ncbi:MAG TPA: biopolymer transporter ExbD [Abditibacteriaceae bacterium]